MAGQDSKSRPMLERTAATVVASTEALAQEEANLLRDLSRERLRVYISVIATTAKIEACKFDPQDIDLEKGTITTAEFEEVPFLRFRKQLSPHPKLPNNDGWADEFKTFAKAKENTVFIIEASKLTAFLQQIELDDRIGYVVSGNR